MTGKSKVLRTVVRDCLYVNWAFRRDKLPSLPPPLAYEEHAEAGDAYVFGSALLFRHEHLHLVGLPFLKLSYPQFNLRLYVRDHEGVPAVYFQRVLVPGWVVPSARWVAHQPALAASFRYPQLAAQPDSGDEWSWLIEQRDTTLGLTARIAAPRVGAGPNLGGWRQTVEYFRQRTRGYVLGSGGLQPVETTQHSASIWPLEVALAKTGLLAACLDLGSEVEWPEVHSAWLCPEIPFEFELSAAGIHESLRRSAPPIAPDPAMFRHRQRVSRRTAA